MLEEICRHIHNDFTDGPSGPYRARAGRFEVRDGRLSPDFLPEGAWFVLEGSAFNDGLHRNPAEGLTDEAFYGRIRESRPPRALVALAAEIAAWREKYGDAAEGPYQSENVAGVYAYAKPAEGRGGWRGAFADRLDDWRRLS